MPSRPFLPPLLGLVLVKPRTRDTKDRQQAGFNGFYVVQETRMLRGPVMLKTNCKAEQTCQEASMDSKQAKVMSCMGNKASKANALKEGATR